MTVSFLSYFLTLTPSVNGFAELPATLISELGCHVAINFKRVGFESWLSTPLTCGRARVDHNDRPVHRLQVHAATNKSTDTVRNLNRSVSHSRKREQGCI